MANPAHAFALSGSTHLPSASPTVANTIAITNLAAGETLVGIDFRPQNGLLYGLGVNAAAEYRDALWHLDPHRLRIRRRRRAGQIAFTTDGVTAVDLPDPATVGYGFDFNPVADRIRVTTDTGLNFRINPNSGLPIDWRRRHPGTNPDGAINAGSTTRRRRRLHQQSAEQRRHDAVHARAVTNSLFIQSPPERGHADPRAAPSR